MFILQHRGEWLGGGQRHPPGSLPSLPQPCKSIRAKQTLQIRRVAFEAPREEGTLWGLPEEPAGERPQAAAFSWGSVYFKQGKCQNRVIKPVVYIFLMFTLSKLMLLTCAEVQ